MSVSTETPPTAIASAFVRAGYKPDAVRLRDVVVAAFAANPNRRNNPGHWDAARDAIFDAVRDDAGLLWELFELYRADAVRRIMTKIAAEMHAAKADGGRVAADNHVQDAPASRPHAQPAASQPRSGETGPIQARQPSSARPASPALSPEEKHDLTQKAREKVAETVRLSMLDTFKIDGQPIGDMNPGVVRSWAADRGREALYVKILTSGMPAVGKVRDYAKPEDADAAWKRAQEEVANVW